METMTPGQWLYLGLLGVTGMVLHSLWAHRVAIVARWRASFPARTVSTVSHGSLSRYVEDERRRSAGSTPFPQEREPEREPERAGNGLPAAPRLDGTLYTSEQIERLKRQAGDARTAELIGLLMAYGLLAEDQRTAAMEAAYGPRGRRWQEAKPLIEQAIARSAPADALRISPIAGRPLPAGVEFADEA